MESENRFLKALELGEQRFRKESAVKPDTLLVNVDGIAMMAEEIGGEVYDEDYTYKGMFLIVCPNSRFPLYKFAYIGE